MQYITGVAREVLEGNMREIVGRMRLEEMVSDRQKFADLVKENAEPDLAAMGLDVVSFNVQNFTDSNGVIDDLGIDNISQIKKKAAIAKAEAEKEIAVAKAEADLFSKEQEAKGIRMVGEAEAEAIRAKGVAEAEAMEKRAQAYQKYNNAAMAEMLIKVLPDIAGKIAEPLTQIDKITIIGGGNGADDGVGNIAGNVPVVMAKLFESMKEATGVDLAEIMKADTMKETVGIDLAEVVKAGTYDAKVNRNITINADGAKQAAEVLKQETAAEASAEIAE